MSAPAPRDRRHALEVGEIEQMLRASCERLFCALFPAARRDGRHLTVGSIAGEPGQSLKMEISGPRQGGWRDFADPDGPEGHGDCIRLIELVLFGGDRGDAVRWAKNWLGLEHLDAGALQERRAQAREAAVEAAEAEIKEREVKRRRAVALWMGAAPIGGTPAEAYLRGRGIVLEADGLDHWPGSLRFSAEVWNREEGVKMPAMLASMVTPDGRHVATHRTYLTWDERRGWVKMDSPNAKMVLGSCRGAFIPLRRGASGKSMAEMPAGEWIHATEGIEDALVGAMARPELRVIAGYSLGNLGSIEVPAAAGGLTLWCDRDPPGSRAIDALEKAIARQQARGTAVRLVLPPQGFKDLNEWLIAQLREARRAQLRAGGKA